MMPKPTTETAENVVDVSGEVVPSLFPAGTSDDAEARH
jgi:hypothetical protein